MPPNGFIAITPKGISNLFLGLQSPAYQYHIVINLKFGSLFFVYPIQIKSQYEIP